MTLSRRVSTIVLVALTGLGFSAPASADDVLIATEI